MISENSEKFEIADALDREIETVWGVIAALNGLSPNTAMNPTSTARYV